MKTRLAQELKKKVIVKQNKVPRHGKGKYDVTVPVLFEFQKNPRENKTLRQKWLESEVDSKERDHQRHMNTANKPAEIPKSTS